ncbi:hypothetical protein LPJ78_005126 [Coemansia sp. RSA 989]|nr:hypothetical protein LPJ79_005077 [Coemansia sp. RSA 1821]KAJ1861783.1 hypothetical protein LPJ78_005126 [Coemansia sp. RSA 989]KAJ1869713.1 hypothetical protein LPJ55_005176 [Coemansia sp. RSA 990]KAJ2648076.1 hypothetical protein IWW40_004164 [Coemansia sp. RSA 1250]
MVDAYSGIVEATKHDFNTYLLTKQQVLMAFYENSDPESLQVMSKLEKVSAASHPDLHICKVNHKNNPYLTARLLLTKVPEVHLLIKDKQWSAYTIDMDGEPSEIAERISKQLQNSHLDAGKNICTPFNFCGKMLATLAEASVAFDRILPLPRWLALLLIPAFMAYIGRFIIDGMYAMEARVKLAFRKDDN